MIFTLSGIVSGYTNSNYKKGIFSDKRLTVFPVLNHNINIYDETITDYLTEDFSVSKADAVWILDSLLIENISKAFLYNSDNIEVVPFRGNINGLNMVSKFIHEKGK